MKTWQMLVSMLLLIFIFSGCSNAPTPHQKKVSKKTYDNDQSTAYIRVDNPTAWKEDDAIMEIMGKKEEWQKKFPEKKLVTMSIVTGNQGGYGNPIVFGLLIHYEKPN